jgi:hypothetical protein
VLAEVLALAKGGRFTGGGGALPKQPAKDVPPTITTAVKTNSFLMSIVHIGSETPVLFRAERLALHEILHWNEFHL